MTKSTGQRKWHIKNIQPKDPAIKRIGAWPPANQLFYHNYRRWLIGGGYGGSTLNTYGVAARIALGYLDKLYWKIDPQDDLEQVSTYFEQHYASKATQEAYRKGLAKLAEYLQKRLTIKTVQDIHWQHYVGPLPGWLTKKVQKYVAFRQKSWPTEQHYRSTMNLLCRLTFSLRWMAAHARLESLADLTPNLWFDYQEMRLADGITTVTTNNELLYLQAFIQYWLSAGEPVCARFLLVDMLDEGDHIPRDVPIEILRRLMAEIQKEAASPDAHTARLGIMDRAWFLLMLHCGLRTCEIRRLKLANIDWEGRKIRIEQSKGLKDRIIFLSRPVMDALHAYLEVRGPLGNSSTAEKLPDFVFTYRHCPLGSTFCAHRLSTYGERCGVKVTPHMLRHSCATLLLNSGAPVLTVQAILGHKKINTTLEYARLYDGTIATDYYRAMRVIENSLEPEEDDEPQPPDPVALLALVDHIAGQLSGATQLKDIRALRAGILHLSKLPIEFPMNDVKVPLLES